MVMPRLSRLGTLGLLTLSFTMGEVAHFLIVVTSKAVASSVQFGDKRCYSGPGSSSGR